MTPWWLPRSALAADKQFVSSIYWGELRMAEHGGDLYGWACYYDGSFFSYAQNHYYHERKLGWLRFPELHGFLEKYIGLREQGFASYKVVYDMAPRSLHIQRRDGRSAEARPQSIPRPDARRRRIPVSLPMSQKLGEKGVDVALAVDALQVGLGRMIDVAILVTGDGDFVPLVRALNKQGVRVLAAYFAFEAKDGGKSFINERLLASANYAVDIGALGSSKEHKQDFATLFWKP